MNRSSRLFRSIYALMVGFLLTFAVSSTFVETATAKPKEVSEFDKLVKAGAKAYDNGDLTVAEESFRKAYEITPDSSLLYNIGRVCEDRADYNCAIDSYRRYIGSSGADADAKEDALARIETCNKYLSVLGTPAPQPTPAGGVAPVAYAAPAAAAANPGNCIDINTASAAQLETIKGLGPAKSKAILEYRSAHPFTNLNQLTEVKGIGAATLEKYKPYLCPIGSAAAPAAAAPAPAPKVAPAVAPSAPASAKSVPSTASSAPKSASKSPSNANSIDI